MAKIKDCKDCKALFIGKKFIDYIESYFTEYQPHNGKGGSHWVFVKDQKGHQYAIEYDPKKEQIEIL